MSEDEREAVVAVLTRYVESYLQADVDALRDVFADDAVMNGYVGERLVTGSPEVFIQNVGKAPPIVSLGGTPTYEIGEVEVIGNVAAVTVRELGFGALNFIDYMHLLKRNGVWKIVSKTFSTF